MKDLRERIEAGRVGASPEPVDIRVDVREERLTIRLSIQEVRAIDQAAKALGVGRSTVIRMLVRQGLGLDRSRTFVSSRGGHRSNRRLRLSHT
jgi:predicted DNA binding CopG/RHH family protein